MKLCVLCGKHSDHKNHWPDGGVHNFFPPVVPPVIAMALDWLVSKIPE